MVVQRTSLVYMYIYQRDSEHPGGFFWWHLSVTLAQAETPETTVGENVHVKVRILIFVVGLGWTLHSWHLEIRSINSGRGPISYFAANVEPRF